MPLLRITNGFDRMADAKLQVRTNSILTSMTGNSSFPTPTPTLADVQAALAAFTAALAVAQSGSDYDKAFKNQKKADLVDLLHSLGNYVLFTANGDELIARSSGYHIAKQPSPVPPVTKAQDLKLGDGHNAGELFLSFKKVPGARSYLYQYAPDPITDTTVWHNRTGTMRKTVLDGLQSNTKYWCRVVAVGINGQAVASDPVARIVQ